MPGPGQTPAERSAEQTHLLASEGQKVTICGIRFRRKRFFDRNIVGESKLTSCRKCTDKLGIVDKEEK